MKRLTRRRNPRAAPTSNVDGDGNLEKLGSGNGSLLFRQGWGRWKPFWFEVADGKMMQFATRGSGKPKQVLRIDTAILKSADDLVGEPFAFGIFLPSRDPFYFRCRNEEDKAAWLGCLTKLCASTEWSTSSMVTAFVDPVVVASYLGVIMEVNDAMLKLFGYERQEVIGKKLEMLMPESVGKHHDSYLQAYKDTGVAKLIGKPRSLVGQHKDGHALHLVVSLGVERASDGHKTFIATLRPDKVKKDMPSKAELNVLLQKAVSVNLDDAQTKIRAALEAELEAIMARMEEYQAQSRFLAAKSLREETSVSMSAQTTEPDDDTDHSTTLTQHGHAKLLNLDTSNIAVGRRLGIGGSGCAVYACNVDGWQCAMKELIVENSKQSDIDQFLAEVFLLESLPPHKNLVRFLFHHKGHASIRIFMCRYEVTLDSFLKERCQRDDFFEQGEVARLALDIVRALEILHDYKIIHRDVKSENLFVNHDMAGNVSHLTLSDFDSAKVLERAGTANTITGTVGWMPPEMFSSAGKSYSFSADVWSFGMVMFELMDLGRPFHDVDEFDHHVYIEEGNLPRFRHPEAMQKRFSGVLPLWKKCCSLKPEDRPTLREIKMDLSNFL